MGPDVDYLQILLIGFLLIFLCGFFSFAKSSIINANDAKIKKMASDGNKWAKKILKILIKPSQFLAVNEVGITLCGFFFTALIVKTYLPVSKLLSQKMNWNFNVCYYSVFVIFTILAAVAIIIFGKLLPKRLSENNAEDIALKVAPIYNVLSIILNPIAKALSIITDLIAKLFGYDPESKTEMVTEEEIRMLVDVGGEKGVIEESEKYMINSIFEMDDREISEIMTHRMDVAAVEKTASLDEILSISTKTGYSRLPVYEEDIDNIIGVVYIKDLIKCIKNPRDFNLEKVMREPLFVPESVNFTELLKIFKKQKKQLAIVVDEYGGTYGIITMEDLLESIVGDIQDEYDNEENEFELAPDGTIIFNGSISLEDAERALDVKLGPDDDEEDYDYDTLGAILINALGHIPEMSEKAEIVLSGVHFTVLKMDGTRILKVKAEIIKSQEQNDEENEDY